MEPHRVKSYADMGGGDYDLRKHTPAFSSSNLQSNLLLVEAFTRLAHRKGCTSGQLALAWVIKQVLIPIPGTKRLERMEENWQSRDVELTDEDMVELRSVIEGNQTKGDR